MRTVLNLGTEGSFQGAKMVRLANMIAIILITVSLIYIPIFLSLGLMISVVLNILFILAYSLVFLLNRMKYHLFAKIWVLSVFMAHIFIATSIHFSRSCGFHYYYLVMPPIIFLIFGQKRLGLKIAMSLTTLFLFYFCELVELNVTYLPLPFLYQRMFHLTTIFADIVGMVILVLLFHSDMKKSEEKLKILATIDPLTSIYNRRELFRMGKINFSFAKRHKIPLSIIMLDLDLFKKVNDTHGHKVGDEVLIWFCIKITQTIRESDIFGRYGGEEFCLVLPNTDSDQARIVASKIQKQLKDENFPLSRDISFPVKVSQGIETLSEDHDDFSSIVGNADKALYQAKKAGRDRFITFGQ